MAVEIGENGEQEEGQEHETQVQVRFTTKLSERFRVVSTPFAVPSSLTRHGLSEVVNALLRLDKSVPFDFLLDGELIRTALGKLLLVKQLSAETILNIEYIPAIVPPEPKDSNVHDDWVSAVDGSIDRFIFTGSYDKFVRIWDSDGACVRVLKGHTGVITSLSLVAQSGSTSENFELVSSSKDRTLHLWQIQSTESSTLETLKPTKCFKGHTASVQGVATSPLGHWIASCSWDDSIKLWKVAGEPEAGKDSTKKQRLDGSGALTEHSVEQVSAQSTLQGHTQCVSAVAYAEEEFLYSVSWDNSIRGWNLQTGVNAETLVGSKALHCLSIGGQGSALIATGGADDVLRIWDPRVVGVAVPVLQLMSHKGWITSCKWHPKSMYHLLSSSHDGTFKLWDVRAKIPLFTVAAHNDKVLCADWWKEDTIVSGGADAKLSISRGVAISNA